LQTKVIIYGNHSFQLRKKSFCALQYTVLVNHPTWSTILLWINPGSGLFTELTNNISFPLEFCAAFQNRVLKCVDCILRSLRKQRRPAVGLMKYHYRDIHNR